MGYTTYSIQNNVPSEQENGVSVVTLDNGNYRLESDHYRIIIDLPDPHNEALNKLYSREYYKILKMRMNTGGFIASQSSSPFYTRKSFWCIEKTMQAAMFSTYSYKVTIPTFGIWGFHIGTVSGKIPEHFNIQVPTKFLNNTAMQSAGIFENDIARLDVPVNSIMEPKLYILYLQELKSNPNKY